MTYRDAQPLSLDGSDADGGPLCALRELLVRLATIPAEDNAAIIGQHPDGANRHLGPQAEYRLGALDDLSLGTLKADGADYLVDARSNEIDPINHVRLGPLSTLAWPARLPRHDGLAFRRYQLPAERATQAAKPNPTRPVSNGQAAHAARLSRLKADRPA